MRNLRKKTAQDPMRRMRSLKAKEMSIPSQVTSHCKSLNRRPNTPSWTYSIDNHDADVLDGNLWKGDHENGAEESCRGEQQRNGGAQVLTASATRLAWWGWLQWGLSWWRWWWSCWAERYWLWLYLRPEWDIENDGDDSNEAMMRDLRREYGDGEEWCNGVMVKISAPKLKRPLIVYLPLWKILHCIIQLRHIRHSCRRFTPVLVLRDTHYPLMDPWIYKTMDGWMDQWIYWRVDGWMADLW